MLAEISLTTTLGTSGIITIKYNYHTRRYSQDNNYAYVTILQVAKEAYRALFVMEPDFGDLVVPGTVMNRLGEQWRASSKEQFNYTYRDVSTVLLISLSHFI